MDTEIANIATLIYFNATTILRSLAEHAGRFHRSAAQETKNQGMSVMKFAVKMFVVALLTLGLPSVVEAQDYRQWDEDKLREELGRLADATRKINVPMRDGVHLSTDVYLPKGPYDSVPTVFWRTPYNLSVVKQMEQT
jgi:predicted acyl esterase